MATGLIAAEGGRRVIGFHKALGDKVVDRMAADTRPTVKPGGNVLGQGQAVKPGTVIGKNAKGGMGALGFGLSLSQQADPKKFKAAGLQIKNGDIIFPNRLTTQKNNNKLGSG